MNQRPTGGPGDVVDRAYELISFSAGGSPAWDEFRALFTTPCVLALRLFPDDSEITVMDLNAYVVAQMREGMQEDGYAEIPGERAITIDADIASVRQHFAMKFGNRPPVHALDVFQLVHIADRWHIASIISDMINQR
jgi:hypothetical protein